jgi:hypothetical protein
LGPRLVMKKIAQGTLALFALGILCGCNSEKPLSEEESMASVLNGTVDPNAPAGKAGSKAAKKVDVPANPGN